ncbi:MAG: SIS domain-containing protein [Geminicoccaceae bacterium]
MDRRFSQGFTPPGVEWQRDRRGLDALLFECRRQHRDARSTRIGQRAKAESVAKAIQTAGRVDLLGMGASHFANQIAATRLRAVGIQAEARIASEALYAPMPKPRRPAILVSQSGSSAEIVKWLESQEQKEGLFGITLSAGSPLAKAIPCLIAEGGSEAGFAATRSFTLTLVLHGLILASLGGQEADALPAEEAGVHPRLELALTTLSSATVFICSARSSFGGLANMTALGVMELGRVPALGLDGGQLRHGPVELLSQSTGVILFRGPGATVDSWDSIVRFCRDAGSPLVVFDSSGAPPIDGAVTLDMPQGEGIGAVLTMAPTQQALVMGLAVQRSDAIGMPRYAVKVMDTE